MLEPGHSPGDVCCGGPVFYRDRTERFSPSSVKSSLLNRVSATSLFPYLGGRDHKGAWSDLQVELGGE